MVHEAWGGYVPEINAGRYEMGAGPTTWVAASEAWMMRAVLAQEATAVMVAAMGLLGINWTGIASTARAAAFIPYMIWLETMSFVAIGHSAACAAVAEAFVLGNGTMIPLPMVNQNRISEAAAEASNVLGQNTGLIAELNREYAQFWAENAGTMETYDDATTLATAPKPVPPAPPMSTMAMASEVGSQAEGSLKTAGSSLAKGAESMGGSDMMSQLMGPVQQIGSQVTQMPTKLMQPAQQLLSPIQQLLGSFGSSNVNPSSGLASGGPGLMDSAVLASTGGSGAGMGAGGGMGGSGVGLRGPASIGSVVPKSGNSVFSGVPERPNVMAGMTGGGGVGPMAGGGAGGARGMHGGGSDQSKRIQPVEAVLASDYEPVAGDDDGVDTVDTD